MRSLSTQNGKEERSIMKRTFDRRVCALSLLLGLLVGVAAAQMTVTPVSKMNEAWWAQRHEAINARVKQGNVDLVLIGDSITHFWETDGKEVWARYYAGRNAVNMGFSGDRTENVLWRIDNGCLDGIQPKACVLMIGTNSAGDCSAEDIGAGIVAVVERIRTKLPGTKILLLAVFPRDPQPDEVRVKLAKASEIASKAADGQTVRFMDIGPKFLQADGTLPKEIMPDFLHLSAAGYGIWAEAIEPQLAEILGPLPPAPPEGFVALFNGKDLGGWKGLVGNPETRAKMSQDELAKAQSDADAKMREHWKIEDGALAFDGKGDSLCTAKDYQDFEMLVDWKIGPKGDSGIYLRGSPQVQIWDPAQWPVGSGGLYNNEKNPKDPLKLADRPIGEWNTFRIHMVGERVTVHLNDALVVNNVVLENYWDRSKPIYPVGQIELQNHSAPLWFRNVYIRELPKVGAVSYADETGFVPLFDGTQASLDANWSAIGAKEAWLIEDGALKTVEFAGGDWLRTKADYADFVLRMDWMVPEYGNSGVGIRCDDKVVFGGGYEIQILAPWDSYRDDLHCTGSIYGAVPVKIRPDETPNIWHSFEITCRGKDVTIVADGVPCVEANMDRDAAMKDKNLKGYLSLQSSHTHAGPKWVKFRNIRIKELK